MAQRFPHTFTYTPKVKTIRDGNVITSDGTPVTLNGYVKKADGNDLNRGDIGDLHGLSHKLLMKPISTEIPNGATLVQSTGDEYRVLYPDVKQLGTVIWLALI